MNDEQQRPKRGRGRPAKGQRGTIILPPEYWQWMADPAGGKRHGLSYSDVVKAALDVLMAQGQ